MTQTIQNVSLCLYVSINFASPVSVPYNKHSTSHLEALAFTKLHIQCQRRKSMAEGCLDVFTSLEPSGFVCTTLVKNKSKHVPETAHGDVSCEV
jgi:hypothetical protein